MTMQSSPSSLDSDNQAVFSPGPRRFAVVLPYQCGEGMEPGCEIWEGLARPLRGTADIFSLTVPWGVLPERSYSAWGGLLEQGVGVTQRQAARDAADRVRAWMHSTGSSYSRIALLAHGPLMDVWSFGVRGTPVAARVKLVKPPRSIAGVNHPSVRRELVGLVTR